jgi:hypothetical protein
VVIAAGVSALVLAGVMLLIPLGLRAGDQPGDAVLVDVEPLATPRGASVTLSNPSAVPVLLGMSLRRAGPRLRLEGLAYVRIRNGHTTSELLAGNQACVGILEAGGTATFAIPSAAGIRRRAELVAVIGQPGRLRTIHRLVVLVQEAGCNEAAVASSASAGWLSAGAFETQ